jgi:hypothetical protein
MDLATAEVQNPTYLVISPMGPHFMVQLIRDPPPHLGDLPSLSSIAQFLGFDPLLLPESLDHFIDKIFCPPNLQLPLQSFICLFPNPCRSKHQITVSTYKSTLRIDP